MPRTRDEKKMEICIVLSAETPHIHLWVVYRHIRYFLGSSQSTLAREAYNCQVIARCHGGSQGMKGESSGPEINVPNFAEIQGRPQPAAHSPNIAGGICQLNSTKSACFNSIMFQHLYTRKLHGLIQILGFLSNCREQNSIVEVLCLSALPLCIILLPSGKGISGIMPVLSYQMRKSVYLISLTTYRK